MSLRQALLGLHLGALAFGLSGIFGELANTSALHVVIGRALFAVLSLGLFLAWLGRPLRIASHSLPWLVVGGLLLGAHWLTFFEAVRISSVAIATLGFSSFPAFTVLLEASIGERPSRLEYLMVALVSAGLLLVAPVGENSSEGLLGLGWAILSGLLFALLSVIGRKLAEQRNDPVQAALMQNLVALLCFLPFAGKPLLQLQPLQWLWLALLGVLCTGIAHSLLVASLRQVKTTTAAVIFSLEPVYGIAFAWLLLSQPPRCSLAAL